MASTASAPIASANESPSVGTWKLIKGRVSQAMEDIKSSKPDGGKSVDPFNDDDSDADSATINSSISDDFNEAVAFHGTPTPVGRVNNTDSDSDLDGDHETDARKGHKKRAAASKIGKTKDEPRPSILRRRKRGTTPPPIRPPRQKDIEIESGVEITEEMSLGAGESVVTDGVEETKEITTEEQQTPTDAQPPTNNATEQPSTPDREPKATNSKSLLQHAFHHRGIVFVSVVGFFCWCCNIPQFIQGVLACLCSMIVFSKFCQAVVTVANQRLSSVIGGGESDAGAKCVPERGSFAIPNYDTLPVCKVPAVEEHKQLKTYAGWMNQINNYDPTNYHISMTRSVFVKLEGSKLSISSTNARVPKRSTWNEQPVDIKSITFTKRNCYDLIGAHIEMCPKGLARKR